jgi:protein-disulfide isomerase
MTTRANAIVSNTLTGVLVACALVVTATTVRRNLHVAPAPAPAIEQQRDWATYARVGQRLGPPDGKVTLVEFSDFQCPACGAFEKRLTEIRRRYPTELTVVYRHYPLGIHVAAMPAARASECAAAQGRFAPMHDALFAERDSLGRIPWVHYADRAGISDLPRFEQCMADTMPVPAIARDVEDGNRLGIRGTPTLLIDGLKITGAVPSDTLDTIVQRALGRHAAP